MLYRIFTEDINRNTIENIVNSFFDGYTLVNSTGYWKGEKEKSLAIEIIGEKEDIQKIHSIARNIKIQNQQECVLVQEIPVNSVFI